MGQLRLCVESDDQYLAGDEDRQGTSVVRLGRDKFALGVLDFERPGELALIELIAFLEHVSRCPCRESRTNVLDQVATGIAHACLVRTADIGEADAEGREHCRESRHQDLTHAVDAGRTTSAHRSGAAECREGCGARIHDELGEGLRHAGEVGLLHFDQGFFEADAEGLGDRRGDHRAGTLRVEAEPTVEVRIAVEDTQQQVDVGDGRLAAAETEASRARCSTDALGSYMDPTFANLDDRAATDSTGMDVAHREGDRHTSDAAASGRADFGVVNRSDVGRRATDVDHQHVLEAVRRGKGSGAFEPAARTGGVRLQCNRLGHAGGCTVIAVDQERVLDLVFAEAFLGVVEESLHDRVQEGIDQARPDATATAAIIGEVPGIEEGHGPQQVPRELAKQHVAQPPLPFTACLTDRHDDSRGAVGREPVDLLNELELELLVRSLDIDDRNAVTDHRVEKIGLAGGGAQFLEDTQVIGDQAQIWSFALDEGVGSLSRRIADVPGVMEQSLQVGLAVYLGRRFGYPVEQALGQVEWRRQGLGELEVLPVPDADVRQRPAVVDVDELVHVRSLGSKLWCAPWVFRGARSASGSSHQRDVSHNRTSSIA